MNDLIKALKSGDTSNANKYLAKVEELSSTSTSGTDPVGKFISSVKSALANNDISSAQSALTTFESETPADSSVMSSLDSTSSTTLNELGADMLNLFSSIKSGDLSGAKSAYSDLETLLGSNSTSSTTSTRSSSSTSSTSSSSSSNSSSFNKLLSDIGSALDSGDINSAQSALDSFMKSVSSGSLVSASA